MYIWFLQHVRATLLPALLGARADLSVQQLMEKGRKEMKAQDDSLIRAQRIVESTIEVPLSGPSAHYITGGLPSPHCICSQKD